MPAVLTPPCDLQEDEAARAYDRMMLWCEIHGAAGSMKGSVTNFDLGEYEKDIAWLTSITQVGCGWVGWGWVGWGGSRKGYRAV